MTDIKKELKDRARLARGLANALGYDVEYVYMDAENYDLICMNESLRETKDTLQKLVDNIAELERLFKMLKK